jgi:maltose-binding protein MalE
VPGKKQHPAVWKTANELVFKVVSRKMTQDDAAKELIKRHGIKEQLAEDIVSDALAELESRQGNIR